MNLVDSSGWIETDNDGPNADFFKPIMVDAAHLVVPTISIFEVFGIVLRGKGQEAARQTLDRMTSGQVVELDVELAASAAMLAHHEKLAVADATILATARRFNATIWTQDVDLKRFDHVKFREKRKA